MPYYNSGHSPAYNKDGGSSGPSSTSGGRASSSEPTYMMEHLATFTVTKETGIVYPADGMRRLLQLEKSNGIWSQKMQLRLERNWVLIMDNETGAVMERFPAALIQEPTAFTSRDPMEMYNNILVFTVADDSGSGQRAEMHIFQCQSVSAQDLVEDLKMLQMGKLVTGGSPRGPRGHIPPPPALPPPEPPLNGVNVREQVSAFNAANDDIVVYNETPVAVNGTSSSVESPNKKLNTSQSIVEVHPPPRNITPDLTPEKPTPPPPPSSALKAPMPALPAPPVTPALPAPAPASSTIPSLPPPPPPPPPSTPTPPLQTQKSITSITSTSNKAEKSNASSLIQVHNELKFVLSIFREKKANSPKNDTQQEIWLNQHSTARDVQTWLAAKGFAPKICKYFENMNGTELFNLTRRQLEQYCGMSEGSRLNGQLTLARNESGYKTARSSELKQILEKARRRAEELNDKDEVKQ